MKQKKVNPNLVKGITDLLEQGYKIYLDKECSREFIRHEFYMNEKNGKAYFYHIKFSVDDFNRSPRTKDYPVIQVTGKREIKSKIEYIVNDITKSYIAHNGYEVSTNKMEGVA